ncbi:MAG: GAF domain-containing protein [Cyanobacteria bacterium P01_D01_bin.105]
MEMLNLDFRQKRIAPLPERFLKVERLVQLAISRLSSYEEYCDNLLSQANKVINFDFASISFVHPEENFIEAVYGYGKAKDWSGRAKHPIEKSLELQDIQVAIALPSRQDGLGKKYRAEIVSGFDSRFDYGIYKQFDHGQYTRIFVPVLLVYNKSGKLVRDWNERYKEVSCAEGNHKIFEVYFDKDEEVRVVGTVEIGFQSSIQEVTSEDIFESLVFAAKHARALWRLRLPGILEVIARQAKKFMQADVATLHFCPSDEIGSVTEKEFIEYFYEVCDGSNAGRRILSEHQPRKEGLGARAIKEGKAKILHSYSKDDSLVLERISKTVGMPVNALGAFPLQVDSRTGCLYVAYLESHEINDDALKWGTYFSSQAVAAIRRAISAVNERNRNRQLIALSSIIESFHEELPDLLEYISWNILNLLAADVVVICEFIKSEKQFLTPLTVSGRLKAPGEISKSIERENNIHFLLFDDGTDEEYITDLEKSEVFGKSAFAKREGIKSLARILLKSGEGEVVGIVFINYRRNYDFSDNDKRMIKAITTSAAITIRNRRLITGLDAVDADTIVTSDIKLLRKKIVKHAVKMTGGTLGNLYVSDKDDPGETYIDDTEYIGYLERGKLNLNPFNISALDKGVVGWVRKHRKSQIINDVKSDPRYLSVIDGMKSEVCVPILKNGSKVFGVLNVESDKNEFTTRHLWILKGLAKTLTVALDRKENVESIAESLIHKLNNDLGAIQMFANNIIMRDEDAPSRDIFEKNSQEAKKIFDLVNVVIKDKDYILEHLDDHTGPIELEKLLPKTVESVYFPSAIKEEISFSDKLPKVFGEEKRLTEVFANLIENAVDAMPEGGKLSISAHPIDQGNSETAAVEIIISDTGIGIPKEDLSKIFRRNYSKKIKRGGMGLGLALSRSFIEQIGGNITIDSTLGKGTRSIVRLPAYLPD